MEADVIFSQVTYDLITIGNHELYSYASAKEIYDHPERWLVSWPGALELTARGGRYLTSNVNITVNVDGKAVSAPVAERVAKFETKQQVDEGLDTQGSANQTEAIV